MWPLYKAFLVVIIVSPFQASACLPPAMMETYTPPPAGQLRQLLQLSNKQAEYAHNLHFCRQTEYPVILELFVVGLQ